MGPPTTNSKSFLKLGSRMQSSETRAHEDGNSANDAMAHAEVKMTGPSASSVYAQGVNLGCELQAEREQFDAVNICEKDSLDLVTETENTYSMTVTEQNWESDFPGS